MASIQSLKDRVKHYQELTDYKLMRHVPQVIIINGRNFAKVSSLVSKPFSIDMMAVMCSSMLKLFQTIDGSVLAYTFSDEIVLISRNDQNADTQQMYDGRIQKIISMASSVASLEFSAKAKEKNIKLFDDPVFTAQVFTLPNLSEVISLFVHKQNQCYNYSLNSACFHELSKRYDFSTVRETLSDKTSEEKIEILKDEFDIHFSNDYPLPFRHGVLSYRRTVPSDNNQIKNKLILDIEVPIISKNQSFIKNILVSGKDILREE